VIPETRYPLDAAADPAPAASQWMTAKRTDTGDRNALRAAPWVFRASLLVVYAIGVAARMPQILLKGRFWGEEGAVYFLNGRNLPWYDALFAVHTGYLNLAASIATLLAARLVPIEQAPWISTGLALLIQLCPPILLLTSGIPWLRNRWAMATALGLLLATTPSAEVWMNAITSQFHLGLCTALILAMPLRGGTIGWFRGVLLVLAPLSGPTSAFLTPLFFVRGYFDRSRQRFFQGMILGCAGAVQLLMILLHPEPAREIGIGPRLFALVVYVKQILLPFLGTNRAQHLTQHLMDDVTSGGTPWVPLLVSGAGMVAIVAAAWRSRNVEARWLLAGGTVMMTMSYFGALGQHIQLLLVTFGDRYIFIPTALFGLCLLGIALTARGWFRAMPTLLVCLLIWTGMHEYLSPGPAFADGSSWRAEIAHWRADPSSGVQFWPVYEVWRWPIAPLPGPTAQ
jgi:hypothetical protein